MVLHGYGTCSQYYTVTRTVVSNNYTGTHHIIFKGGYEYLLAESDVDDMKDINLKESKESKLKSPKGLKFIDKTLKERKFYRGNQQ